ncbi:MAG: family 43 glycosylhydrolase [Bacteroidota bacterium]|nr:family 43 glycosylhydrolase [Bacteroidota bacterium]
MNRHILALIFFLPVFLVCTAQNPICPPGIYIADPSARVWNDSNLYIYGSSDESCDYYCSRQHDIIYTRDMEKWQLEKNVFASNGENDKVPYNNSLLFAPDCAEKNGRYYLYYCQPDRDNAEGVTVSDSPTGPFSPGEPIDTGPYKQIDPGVFIYNDVCNSGNWNNHGSIAEFKGQWYVFYHRSTHGCKTMRKACIEKITFLDNGTIPEVKMTSQGSGMPLKAINGGKIVLSAGKPWERRICEYEAPEGLQTGQWLVIELPAENIEGIHALWIQCYGGEGDLFEIDWLVFN